MGAAGGSQLDPDGPRTPKTQALGGVLGENPAQTLGSSGEARGAPRRAHERRAKCLYRRFEPKMNREEQRGRWGELPKIEEEKKIYKTSGGRKSPFRTGVVTTTERREFATLVFLFGLGDI